MFAFGKSVIAIAALIATSFAFGFVPQDDAQPAVKFDRELKEVRRYDAREAGQAVAVDDGHFYAIANSIIVKYDRETGERVATWKSDKERPLRHLNSGIVRDGKLY